MSGSGSVIVVPFVGSARHALVHDLVNAFDEVKTSGVPTWWSLEANVGWGKTRILQEFYARLAADRQGRPAYWPPSVLPAIVTGNDARSVLENNRKRVYPEETPTDGAVPHWFWWGIACSSRGGTPTQALADDLTQFRAHESGLTARWKQLVPRATRSRKAIAAHTEGLAGTAIGEAATAAASAASLAIPGLGFILWAASQGLRAARDRSQATGSAIDATGSGRHDLVDDLAPALGQLAAVGVPLVVVVEDLHDADRSLIELLARLLSGSGPVLVITTAWRGLLDDNGRDAHRLLSRVQPAHLHRVRGEDDVGPLNIADLRLLASAFYPELEAASVDRLCEQYPNPFALQLACHTGAIRRAAATGTIPASVVGAIPPNIDDLHRRLWQELPAELRTVLMVAVLTSPEKVSAEFGFGDRRWDHRILASVVDSVDWMRNEVSDLSARLVESAEVYGWVRFLDDWLRQFHEPAQHDLAASEAATELAGAEASLYEALVDAALKQTDDSTVGDIHRARLITALAVEGFAPWTEATVGAAAEVCEHLLELGGIDDARQVTALAGPVLSVPRGLGGALIRLREAFAMALGYTGHHAEAVEQFRKVLDDRALVGNGDEEALLQTRYRMIAFRVATGDLIQEAVELVNDQERVLGKDNLPALRTRNLIAAWFFRRRHEDEARRLWTELLADQVRIVGVDHEETLMTRFNLVGVLTEQGELAVALEMAHGLLGDQERVLGPQHPEAFRTREMVAKLVSRLGDPHGALDAFRDVLSQRTRVLGSDHPITLHTRLEIDHLLGNSGDVELALAESRGLLVDQQRVLGSDHEDLLANRALIAHLLRKTARWEEALQAAQSLLTDQEQALGPDHPDTASTREDLADLLHEQGRLSEAIDISLELVAVQLRTLGPQHEDTRRARRNIARLFADAHAWDEAVTWCDDLLRDEHRLLGPDHPNTRQTEHALAEIFLRANQSLLSDRRRLLGADHPDTVASQAQVASFLAKVGDDVDALEAWRDVVAGRTRLLGADHPDTLQGRAEAIRLLGKTGQREAQIEHLRALFADAGRVFGVDHAKTSAAREALERLLGEGPVV